MPYLWVILLRTSYQPSASISKAFISIIFFCYNLFVSLWKEVNNIKLKKLFWGILFSGLLLLIFLSIYFQLHDFILQVPKYSVFHSLLEINWLYVFDWAIIIFIIYCTITGLLSLIEFVWHFIFQRNFNLNIIIVFVWTIGIITWMMVSLNNDFFNIITAIFSLYVIIYQFTNQFK